jgi:hypothetical protein
MDFVALAAMRALDDRHRRRLPRAGVGEPDDATAAGGARCEADPLSLSRAD